MNEELSKSFPPSAFVKAALLREPLYVEDGDAWRTLVKEQNENRSVADGGKTRH